MPRKTRMYLPGGWFSGGADGFVGAGGAGLIGQHDQPAQGGMARGARASGRDLSNRRYASACKRG